MGPKSWIALLCLLETTAAAAELGPRLRLTDKRAPQQVLLRFERDPPVNFDCVGRICRAPLSARADLSHLLRMPGLASIDWPARYRLRLDQAAAWTGIRDTSASRSETGRGVLIAIIDTGLDWRHEDFIDASGQSRVRWLLDQTMSPAGLYPELEERGAGAVFSRSELQTALDDGTGPAVHAGADLLGHGTHIAGIAAGAHPVYTGVAPQAELIVAKTVGADGQVDEAQVLAALSFCLEAARQADLPLVINLSLGDQLGAHDGSTPLEQALSAAAAGTSPACAVCVAAGNDAELDWHARLRLRPLDPPSNLIFSVPESGGRPSRILLDLWYSEDGPVCLHLLSPDGEDLIQLCPGRQATEISQQSSHGFVGMASERHPERRLARVLIELGGDELAGGRWTLRLWGDSRRVDAWIADLEEVNWPWPAFLTHVDGSNLVGPPATAQGALAVGAFGARTSWRDMEGIDHQVDGWPGLRTDFSSPGPSLDGRLKPDLLAPGLSVASSLSAETEPRRPDSIFYASGGLSRLLPGGRHAVASGTSMASPYVAGLCALVFENHPRWTGFQVRQHLIASARSDIGGHEASGHGCLNAPACLTSTDGQTGLSMDTDLSLCSLSQAWLPADAGQAVQLVFVPRDSSGQPLGPGLPVSLESEPAGAPFAGPVQDLGAGVYVRALTAGGLHGQSYRLRCELAEGRAGQEPSLLIADAPERAVRSGGCATPSGGRMDRWSLWFVGLIFAWKIARCRA